VIEGRSTVNSFECRAAAVDGEGTFDGRRAGARLLVPVDSIDCGSRRMNRDFHEAMEASEHPEIRFELTDARTVTGSDDGDRIAAEGTLTIAGRSRIVEISATARSAAHGNYRVLGRKELRMTDFGIDPPTALAGLIRAHDRIVIRFDLLASLYESADTRSLHESSETRSLHESGAIRSDPTSIATGMSGTASDAVMQISGAAATRRAKQ
jgi:polyisoprenoid-binding protein YceI